MSRADASVVVAAARHWIGTPYRHQASCKGAGADCLGLIRGLWRDLLGHEPVDVPGYTADWSEVAGHEALWHAARAHLVERAVEERCVGDVLLFRMRGGAVAKHLGVLSSDGPAATFIHAYGGHGVVESALSEPWARRVAAVFSFPGRG